MEKVTDKIFYTGVQSDGGYLFENQYEIPNGVTYNSYVIMDEKVAVLETSDERVTEQWLSNLHNTLGERKPDYLIVSHMEPDHAGNIGTFLKEYPNTLVVANAKTFDMIGAFFDELPENQRIVVKEGSTLPLGEHTLQFFMAPMVHWPEVMVEYEQKEKILFSADGFGTFGKMDSLFLPEGSEDAWQEEAGRYYLNIVGKYGKPVQQLLKKASGLDIAMICPLHGPVLKHNLGRFIDYYDTWSSYQADKKGAAVISASIYGNTDAAAKHLVQCIKEEGMDAVHLTLAGKDPSYAVAAAFRYETVIFACATYDGGLFPCMETLLNRLVSKSFQGHRVGFLENGSWAPMAAAKMKVLLEKCGNIEFVEPVVTIKSALKKSDDESIRSLAKAIAQKP